MSKEAIAAFDPSGKNHNSRPVKEVEEEQKAAVVPGFDENIDEVKPLEISAANSDVVMDSFNKQQSAYVKQNAAKSKVRKAQDTIREHNAGYGRNNPEYTKLSNELNTLTQELATATQQYELDKASYKNDKRRFGKAVTF